MTRPKQYERQAAYNMVAFLTSPEYRERLEVLKEISKVFDENGILWQLTCSTALFFRGMLDDFNDFDILVLVEDFERAQVAWRSIGILVNDNTPQKEAYFASPYYKQARKGNVELELMADLSLKTFGGLYTFKANQGTENISIEGNICLPLIPIEAQLVLYAMMEGWQTKRFFKREICREFLEEMKKNQNPLRYHEILEDALKQNIPKFIKEVISSLLK